MSVHYILLRVLLLIFLKEGRCLKLVYSLQHKMFLEMFNIYCLEERIVELF